MAQKLEPVPGRKVLVLKRGATVQGTQSSANINVYAGALRFTNGDIVQVGLDSTKLRIVGTPAVDTILPLTSTVDVTDGDRILNLEADTAGAVWPVNYDGSTVDIFDRPDDGATALTNNMVETDADGEYYWYAAAGIYDEVVLDINDQTDANAQVNPDVVVEDRGRADPDSAEVVTALWRHTANLQAEATLLTGRLGEASTATTGGALRIVDGVVFAKTVAGVQAALDEVEAAGGGTVMLPAGANISVSTASIKVPNRTKLLGLGNYTSSPTFTAAASANLTAMVENKSQDGTQQVMQVENIYLYGNKAGGSTIGAGILCKDGCYAGSYLRDVLVTDCSGNGIKFDGGSTHGVGVAVVDTVSVTRCNDHNILVEGMCNDGIRFNSVNSESVAAAKAMIYIDGNGETSSHHRLSGIHMEGTNASDGIVLDSCSDAQVLGAHWDGGATQLNVVKIVGATSGSDGTFGAAGHVLIGVMGNLTTIIDDDNASVTLGNAQSRFVPFYISPVANANTNAVQMVGVQPARYGGQAGVSAGVITPEDGNVFTITGTVNITDITNAARYAGREITLIFTHVTPGDVVHGNNIVCRAATNIDPAQNDTATFISDGTSWYEVAS